MKWQACASVATLCHLLAQKLGRNRTVSHDSQFEHLAQHSQGSGSGAIFLCSFLVSADNSPCGQCRGSPRKGTWPPCSGAWPCRGRQRRRRLFLPVGARREKCRFQDGSQAVSFLWCILKN